MQTVTVDLGQRSYPIELGEGLLSRVGELMKAQGIGGRVGVVSNPAVADLYAGEVRESLRDAGYETALVLIPEGEAYKNTASLGLIYDALVEHRFDRSATLIALGGGVIGDVTGFAAATFLRGIGYVQIPTTLLAQVDASVGGKTAVNHEQGKNLIGAFHQPRLVVIDLDTLRTLPRREYAAGMAEVIKYGIIEDAAFFVFLEQEMDALLRIDANAVEHAVATSCRIKAGVVEQDERETDRRAILNFGHTIGHALEAFTGYERFLHGEAVAVGMIQAAALSAGQGLCSAAELRRIEALVRRADLPWRIPDDIALEDLIAGMALDKKSHAGKIKFVLCEGIGGTRFQWFSPEEIVRELASGL
ncbi:MAG: 3-dehydroquinate synthase [Deltaproteobacteria bacterium]|nr:3-dehydroquinate synthase [Deltaproteobacteria bacterium]